METKRVTLTIPPYLTLDQYVKMNEYKGDSKFGKLVHTVASLSGYEFSDVRQWDIDSLSTVANKYAEIADHDNEFHAILEWNGTLYGYAHVRQFSVGEYIDLENLAKDLDKNLHKVAAILYRPITKHRFDSLSFMTKQSIKMANNKVENVFDWYEVEKYDADTRRDRELEFKDFPIHILLGAISFFLSTGTLYLNSIASSEDDRVMKKMKMKIEEEILISLGQNIGAGGGLFTTSLSPTYYRLTGQSQ